jgi:DNA-binding MarR family transcriptional regulator
MNENTEISHQEIADIILRLLYLKNRFRGKLPDKLMEVKASFHAHNLNEKFENINDRDIFSLMGIVFSRQSEPIAMGELSRMLGIPYSTATRMVDWLVRNEYVQRSDDPEDRRIVRVELTASGKELYLALNDTMVERVEILLGNFSTKERKDLVHLLGKLVDNLAQYPL